MADLMIKAQKMQQTMNLSKKCNRYNGCRLNYLSVIYEHARDENSDCNAQIMTMVLRGQTHVPKIYRYFFIMNRKHKRQKGEKKATEDSNSTLQKRKIHVVKPCDISYNKHINLEWKEVKIANQPWGPEFHQEVYSLFPVLAWKLFPQKLLCHLIKAEAAQLNNQEKFKASRNSKKYDGVSQWDGLVQGYVVTWTKHQWPGPHPANTYLISG